MGIITALEKGKRMKERYNVYIDGEFVCSLDQELIVKYHIKTGMEVQPEQIKEWAHEDDSRKSFDMALRYLGYRPRSQKELRDYLAGKGFDPGIIESTISKLIEYRFLDDHQFSLQWIQNRLGSNSMGKRLIQQELYQKGIEPETVNEILGRISEDEEIRHAMKLVQKYSKRYEGLQGKEKIYKIGQALARRGFGWEVINKALRKSIECEETEESN